MGHVLQHLQTIYPPLPELTKLLPPNLPLLARLALAASLLLLALRANLGLRNGEPRVYGRYGGRLRGREGEQGLGLLHLKGGRSVVAAGFEGGLVGNLGRGRQRDGGVVGGGIARGRSHSDYVF